jgi:hypothetical protein
MHRPSIGYDLNVNKIVNQAHLSEDDCCIPPFTRYDGQQIAAFDVHLHLNAP